MDELIDILDENGNQTGKVELKSKAHQMGLFHATVHIWCYSKTGKVLLQQRGANKKTHPLKWDVSVAGHIGAGETPEIGAFREVQEEIGVTINSEKLQPLTILKIEKKYSDSFWDREFTNTFLYQMQDDIPLTKQKAEVEALQWITLQEFEKKVLENDQMFVDNSEDRYKEVIAAIKSRL